MSSNEKKAQKHKQKKEELKRHATSRSSSAGAPNFGFSESDALKLKHDIGLLVQANNNIFKTLDQFAAIKEKAEASYLMCQMIFKLLVDKGIATKEEIDGLFPKTQTENKELIDAPEGYEAKWGDTLLINMIILDGEQIVKKGEGMIYKIGDGSFSCERDLVGVMKGESRYLEVVFNQSNFNFADLIGKTLHLSVQVLAIKIER